MRPKPTLWNGTPTQTFDYYFQPKISNKSDGFIELGGMPLWVEYIHVNFHSAKMAGKYPNFGAWTNLEVYIGTALIEYVLEYTHKKSFLIFHPRKKLKTSSVESTPFIILHARRCIPNSLLSHTQTHVCFHRIFEWMKSCSSVASVSSVLSIYL